MLSLSQMKLILGLVSHRPDRIHRKDTKNLFHGNWKYPTFFTCILYTVPIIIVFCCTEATSELPDKNNLLKPNHILSLTSLASNSYSQTKPNKKSGQTLPTKISCKWNAIWEWEGGKRILCFILGAGPHCPPPRNLHPCLPLYEVVNVPSCQFTELPFYQVAFVAR